MNLVSNPMRLASEASSYGDDPDEYRLSRFFQHLASSNGLARIDRAAIVVVSHVLPDKPAFVAALEEYCGRVIAVVPKRVDAVSLHRVGQRFPVVNWCRAQTEDASYCVPAIEDLLEPGEELFILDVGGYFAKSARQLARALPLKGIIEKTENGHQRYERLSCAGDEPARLFPVYSTARSPLKLPEDIEVGRSIVFSCEALLRDHYQLLTQKRVGVLGCGKIGMSIAETMSRRGNRVHVFEPDPLRRIHADVQNLVLAKDKREILTTSDIIFSATGNRGLAGDDFDFLKDGAYVVGVTSADDELDLSYVETQYDRTTVAPYIDRYSNGSMSFHLLYDGNSLNFIHKGIVGEYICLVQMEIFVAFHEIASGVARMRCIDEVSTEGRREIARLWEEARGHVRVPRG